MIINKKLSEDLEVTTVNEHDSNYDDDENYVINSIVIQIIFFGKEFTAWISLKDIDVERPSFISIEGPSVLFDSCQDQLEETHWPALVEICKEFVSNAEAETE